MKYKMKLENLGEGFFRGDLEGIDEISFLMDDQQDGLDVAKLWLQNNKGDKNPEIELELKVESLRGYN